MQATLPHGRRTGKKSDVHLSLATSILRILQQQPTVERNWNTVDSQFQCCISPDEIKEKLQRRCPPYPLQNHLLFMAAPSNLPERFSMSWKVHSHQIFPPEAATEQGLIWSSCRSTNIAHPERRAPPSFGDIDHLFNGKTHLTARRRTWSRC